MSSTPWLRLSGMNPSPKRGDGRCQSSPPRDVEPMDLDLSSDSPKASIFSTLESSDLDTGSLSNQRTSAQSSPISWKTASHVIGSVLSLRNHKVTSFPESEGISKEESINRPFSAPLFSDSALGSAYQYPNSRPQTSAACLSSRQLPPRMQAAASDSFRKRKKGYGIPESDGVFSHFPDSSVAGTKKSFHGISSGNEKSMSQLMEQNSELKVERKTIADKNHFQDKRRKMNCCILLVPLLMLPVLYLSVTIYFNYCKSLIHFSPTVLEEIFNRELFGQHIAAKIIPEKLQLHFNRFRLIHNSSTFPFIDTPKGDCHPLVLSFHGGTGVGKTFISRLIAHSFHVVQLTPLNIPLIFPHRSTSQLEAEEMYRQVKENLCHCTVNIFMVDEMDKAPDGVVSGLSDAIKDLSSSCNPWYPSVFLFLSNTHASEINLLYKKLLSGSNSMLGLREDLNSDHFESLFNQTIRWYGKLAQQVDAFVPFLPLEKKHAVQCIERDLQAKDIPVTPGLLNEVMKELTFSEYGDLTFSPTGCKRISDKVDFVSSKIEENKLNRDVSDL